MRDNLSSNIINLLFINVIVLFLLIFIKIDSHAQVIPSPEGEIGNSYDPNEIISTPLSAPPTGEREALLNDDGNLNNPQIQGQPQENIDPSLRAKWETLYPKIIEDFAKIDGFILAENQKLKDFISQESEIRRKFENLKQINGYIFTGHPLERDDILIQLSGLRNQIEASLNKLDESLNDIERKETEINNLKTTLDVLIQGGTEDEVSSFLLYYKTQIEKLVSIHREVNNRMKFGNELQNEIKSIIANISAVIPQLWSNYYFAESTLLSSTIQEYTSSEGYLSKWIDSYSSKLIFLYPQERADWINSLIIFFSTAFIMTLIGIFLWWTSYKIEGEWIDALHLIIKGPWVFLAVGASLYLASLNSLGGKYIFFSLPGIIILIWGFASSSWKLWIAAKNAKTEKIYKTQVIFRGKTFDRIKSNQSSPLSRFFVPAAMGVVLLFADLPPGLITIIWVIVIIFFLIRLRRISQKMNRANVLSITLEKFSYGSALPFSVISLFFAIIGYPRLAILIFMILFTIVNSIILGYACMNLGSSICERIFNPKIAPIKNSLLSAFLLPFSCFISLLSAYPWIKAIPGSQYIIITKIVASGYFSESAKISFWRILIILILFFFFKSLKELGTTSLDLISDNSQLIGGRKEIAYVFFTYVIWFFFILISLAILGVDFTSLGIAAGGLGVGISFALQQVIYDYVSGIIIIFGRSITTGNWLDLNGEMCQVTKIGIRFSEVVSISTCATILIPNSKLISQNLTKWSQRGQIRRCVTLQTFPDVNCEQVIQILTDTTQTTLNALIPFFDPIKLPLAVLSNHNQNFLEFNLYFFIDKMENALPLDSQVRIAVENAFEINGVKFYRQFVDINFPESLDLKTIINKDKSIITLK
jgi:small-conductance mechanosensitive channel